MSPANNWQDKIKKRNSELRSPTEQAVFPMGTPNADDKGVPQMSETNVSKEGVVQENPTNDSDVSTEQISTTPEKETSVQQINSTHVYDTNNVHIKGTHEVAATEVLQSFKNSMKRETVEDTHTRKTFIVRNDLLRELDKLSKKQGRGFQTWFVNLAFERLIDEIKGSQNNPKK